MTERRLMGYRLVSIGEDGFALPADAERLGEFFGVTFTEISEARDAVDVRTMATKNEFDVFEVWR